MYTLLLLSSVHWIICTLPTTCSSVGITVFLKDPGQILIRTNRNALIGNRPEQDSVKKMKLYDYEKNPSRKLQIARSVANNPTFNNLISRMKQRDKFGYYVGDEIDINRIPKHRSFMKTFRGNRKRKVPEYKPEKTVMPFKHRRVKKTEETDSIYKPVRKLTSEDEEEEEESAKISRLIYFRNGMSSMKPPKPQSFYPKTPKPHSYYPKPTYGPFNLVRHHGKIVANKTGDVVKNAWIKANRKALTSEVKQVTIVIGVVLGLILLFTVIILTICYMTSNSELVEYVKQVETTRHVNDREEVAALMKSLIDRVEQAQVNKPETTAEDHSSKDIPTNSEVNEHLKNMITSVALAIQLENEENMEDEKVRIPSSDNSKELDSSWFGRKLKLLCCSSQSEEEFVEEALAATDKNRLENILKLVTIRPQLQAPMKEEPSVAEKPRTTNEDVQPSASVLDFVRNNLEFESEDPAFFDRESLVSVLYEGTTSGIFEADKAPSIPHVSQKEV